MSISKDGGGGVASTEHKNKLEKSKTQGESRGEEGLCCLLFSAELLLRVLMPEDLLKPWSGAQENFC